MFRAALLRSARTAATRASQAVAPIARPATRSAFLAAPRFAPALQTVRCYSAPAALSQSEVEGRIVELLKNFDKVTNPDQLTATSHFANDLGLDSLDSVEVVMAIEEEFSIEIPDKDADAINSVDKAVEYILAQPDAH